MLDVSYAFMNALSQTGSEVAKKMVCCDTKKYHVHLLALSQELLLYLSGTLCSPDNGIDKNHMDLSPATLEATPVLCHTQPGSG
jgi:hypothetical protein